MRRGNNNRQVTIFVHSYACPSGMLETAHARRDLLQNYFPMLKLMRQRPRLHALQRWQYHSSRIRPATHGRWMRPRRNQPTRNAVHQLAHIHYAILIPQLWEGSCKCCEAWSTPEAVQLSGRVEAESVSTQSMRLNLAHRGTELR